MAIIRKNFDNRYVRISNTTIRDKELSWQATGLLAYLLSHSDGYKISIRSLTASKTNGEHSTRKALNELREKGYVHFIGKDRNEQGEITHSIWDIYETPQQSPKPQKNEETLEDTTDSPCVENPHVDIPHVDIPHVENQHISERPIKEQPNKEYKYKENKYIQEITQKQTKKTKPSPSVKRTRKRTKIDDFTDIWLAFMETQPENLSPRQWKEIHKATQEILEIGATTQDLKTRCIEYALRDPNRKYARTPNAIMKNWTLYGQTSKTQQYIQTKQAISVAEQYLEED